MNNFDDFEDELDNIKICKKSLKSIINNSNKINALAGLDIIKIINKEIPIDGINIENILLPYKNRN